MKLAVDDKPVSAKIEAARRWAVTDIVLERGGTYRFAATGEWLDARIRYDPDGTPIDGLTARQWLILKAAAPLRRVRSEGWFVLIGAVDCDARTAFRIGMRRTVTMTVGGTLTCFANDVPSKYENNSGAVELTVERIG